MDILERFLDDEGNIKQLPSKKDARLVVLSYLAEKFEVGRDYTEKEVNAIIDGWHTFGDYFLLRRELIDSGLMRRTRDGARYWKEEKAEE
jgi:hypothetical protein